MPLCARYLSLGQNYTSRNPCITADIDRICTRLEIKSFISCICGLSSRCQGQCFFPELFSESNKTDYDDIQSCHLKRSVTK